MKNRFFSSVFILVLAWSAGTAWGAGPMASHERLPHTFAPRPGVSVVIERQGPQWVARLPGGHRQTLVEAMDDDERGRTAPLLQADFNYDGHTDLALVAGVGYGGAVATYWVFLWDDAARNFRKFPAIVGNPELEPRRKALIAWERDGPRWTSTEYRSLNGVLTSAVMREQNILPSQERALDQLTFYVADSGKVTDSRIVSGEAPTNVAPESLPAATARITQPKVWLHHQPDGKNRTPMYVVKGDTVTLLDYKPPVNERDSAQGWLFVRFQGRKTLELWIEAAGIAP